MARQGPSRQVRQRALERITTQDMLADIARHSTDREIRRFAVERLTDEWILAEVAKEDTDSQVCLAALALVLASAALFFRGLAPSTVFLCCFFAANSASAVSALAVMASSRFCISAI